MKSPSDLVIFALGIVVGWQWGYFWADARRQIKENRMSEFRVGDRVKVTHYGKTRTDSEYAGQVGTISSLPRDDWSFYRVALDNDPSGMEWYDDLPVNEDEIEHVVGE